LSYEGSAARIGRWPALAVLGLAALVGVGFGTWLGSQGNSPPPGPIGSPTATLPAASSPPASFTAVPTATAVLEPPPLETVLELSGTGDQVSDPFDVSPGWQVSWQTAGERFALAITGDQDLGTVVDLPGPASGVTAPVSGGTFRLEVTAEGPWSITVVQGTS
jgi:hypothetical protein